MVNDTKFYLIDVDARVGPSALGPYDTRDERDEEAKRVRARQIEIDTVFWADVGPHGTIKVGGYPDGLLFGT